MVSASAAASAADARCGAAAGAVASAASSDSVVRRLEGAGWSSMCCDCAATVLLQGAEGDRSLQRQERRRQGREG